MSISTQPYKGARDFYPEDMQVQDFMFETMSRCVEKFGYEQYNAPILEPTELFASKTSDEIVNEQTYTFTDRGNRSVTIRTEMTPSVSRMVAARRQELSYPVRWYSIPNIWRYERPQRGRLREFWQLNVDIFGVAGIEADQEVILVADSIMQSFKAKRNMYTIKINSRKLMDILFLEVLNLDQTQAKIMAQLIDRMNKIEYAEFVAKLEAIFRPDQRDKNEPQMLLDFLKTEDIKQLPDIIKSQEAFTKLTYLAELLEQAGVSNVQFDPTLMRGFDYYTDIVFEVFDNNPDNNRSMFGGGRYDGLVSMFGVEPVPTVGFGMGDVTLQNFLESNGLMPSFESNTDIYVVLIGDVFDKSSKVLNDLRSMGLNVAVDFTGRKPEKQIKTAVKKQINYALFIGEKELETQQYVLKNLSNGSSETHGLERIVSIVKDYRQKP